MTQTAHNRQHRHCWQTPRRAAAGWARTFFKRGLRRGPIFTLLGALLSLATAAGCGRPQTDRPAARDGRDKASKTGARLLVEAEGAQQLRQAAKMLERHPAALRARIRQTVNVLGHQMVGAGEYVQMPNPAADDPAGLLSRMDLRLQLHDRMAHWKQVCDGKFIWTQSKVPDDDKTLSRSDGEPGYSTRLERVSLAEVVERNLLPRDDEGAPVGSVSGLPRMLHVLADAFDFAPPRPGRIAGVEVLILEGQWRPPYLTQLVPAQKAAAKAGQIDLGLLPQRMPDRVTISLGKEDLFPFRIVYSRAEEEGEMVRDVMTLELYEVNFNAPLKADQIKLAFKRKHRDATARFIRTLERSPLVRR